MIEIQNLTKYYGDHLAISDLTFSIREGEIVGFLGPNGAGKSTTMRIITGAMAPSSGLAKVNNFDVFESPIEVKKQIGYLPETPPLYLEMSVKDYLSYVYDLRSDDTKLKKSLVERALKKTQLEGVKRRTIMNLSKGFRQRVGIAQAIVTDPKVLILDEPTVGLDPKQVQEIRDLLNELKGQHTIILSTHILREVEATCQKVIIINRGKIVLQDELSKLSQTKLSQNVVLVRFSKSKEAVHPILSKAEDVHSFDFIDSSGEYRVVLKQEVQDLDQLMMRFSSLGLGLLELRKDRMNLEDVFLDMTYGEGKTQS